MIAGDAIIDLTAAARPTGRTSFGPLIQIKPCKRRLRHCCLLPPTPGSFHLPLVGTTQNLHPCRTAVMPAVAIREAAAAPPDACSCKSVVWPRWIRPGATQGEVQ